ncbi:MAG: hypothetical protein P4L62_01390 [Candidatus Pacebacteria bacterium]|nr:hypothetical protein [Candidatus Paceibacterota bacterium]
MKIFLFCLILFCSLFSFSSAHAATVIYRSVGAGNTANLNANSRTVTISGTTVTFSGAMPNNVGVGDVLQYQISSTYYLAFISSRTSSTQYTVQAADGGAPQAAPSGTAVNVYRAYTSLADAVTGSGLENPAIDASVRDFDSWTGGKDLVTADEQWNIACYSDAEDLTTGVAINNSAIDWVTDDTHYIKIYTPYLSSEVGISQRPNGAWDDSKYRLDSDDDTNGPPMNINSANVWIDGLQIFSGATMMGTDAIDLTNTSGKVKISNSILKADPVNGMSNFGINISTISNAGIYQAWNNIIYGFLQGGISLDGSANILYAYNNTTIGSAGAGEDICYNSVNGTFVAKNDIAQNCATGYGGTFDSNSQNNLSDLSSDAPGTNSTNNSSLTFADSTNADYHLNASDTTAIGDGINLSADTNLSFSTDIDSDSRPATGAWDIGADEYVSLGNATTPAACTGLSVY